MNAQPVSLTPTSHFAGSIPRHYDEDLGPLLFRFPAADLARRISRVVPTGGTVLEVACGTGIATEYLRAGLDPAVAIVASDLNPDMLTHAVERRGHLEGVRFEQADALALPYPDASFDAVVCQFGIMFFPDKARGFAEMARVLRPGGTLLWNVWGSLATNPVADITQQTLARLFPADPPRFLDTPFGFYDHDANRRLAAGAGLDVTDASTVRASVEHGARAAAVGLIQGTPSVAEVRARGSVNAVTEVVRAALESAHGSARPSFALEQHVFTARKPAAIARND